MIDLKQIQQAIEDSETGRNLKQQWNPTHCGEIDIRIAKDGTWYHEGTRIKRLPLVKLFASVLRREANGEYYLVTPVEKMRIRVEDAPFIAHTLEITHENSQQTLVFTTNLDEQVIADREHPIRIAIHPHTQEPRPYVMFRNGLEALISRSAFMDLINASQLKGQGDMELLEIQSQGITFRLGSTHQA